MTELTDQQRVERATRATYALEEFLEPAFAVLQAEYTDRIEMISAKEPWAANKISALANAKRVVTEVRNQIHGLVEDGKDAASKINRAQTIEQLSPAKRRLLNIAPF